MSTWANTKIEREKKNPNKHCLIVFPYNLHVRIIFLYSMYLRGIVESLFLLTSIRRTGIKCEWNEKPLLDR